MQLARLKGMTISVRGMCLAVLEVWKEKCHVAETECDEQV